MSSLIQFLSCCCLDSLPQQVRAACSAILDRVESEVWRHVNSRSCDVSVEVGIVRHLQLNWKTLCSMFFDESVPQK